MRVVFFDIDCLRPDHLGCYGYPRSTSPAIDSIAAEGMRFNRYYCSSSPCLPSRAAWISGQYGIHSGAMSNVGVGKQFRLVQPHGREGGAYDGDIVRVPELMPRHLRRHGTDSISISNFADRHHADWFLYGWTETQSVNLKGGREHAPDVTAKALRWLQNNRDRDNYFLHVNLWDAHRCYDMEPSWADRYARQPVPQTWPDEATIQRHGAMTGLFTAHGQFPNDVSPFPLMPGAITSRESFDHLVNGYDTAIAYVDHHVQLILSELEAQGILDDTAIVISADHGDAFGEHGIYSDHFCADECVQRIPLIVRWPGIAGGGACDEMLYNTDFYPTLCGLLGIPLPEQIDGESFAACLRGDSGPDRDHLVWDTGNYTVQRAVRTRTHLFLKTYDTGGCAFESIELYDIDADPFQTRNLAQSLPEVTTRCEGLLAEWEADQMRKPTAIEDPLHAILAERCQ